MLSHELMLDLLHGAKLVNLVGCVKLVTNSFDQLDRIGLRKRSDSVTQGTMHISMFNPEVEQPIVLHINK